MIQRSQGFSLLEVLIAMMVLSIGAASVLSLFAAAAGTHKRSQDRTQAALVAERLIAEVQGRYTPDSELESLEKAIKNAVPKLFGEYRWSLDMLRPASDRRVARKVGGDGEEDVRDAFEEDELLVRVEVRWRRSGNARAEVFTTILLPRNDPNTEPKRPGPTKRRGGLNLKR